MAELNEVIQEFIDADAKKQRSLLSNLLVQINSEAPLKTDTAFPRLAYYEKIFQNLKSEIVVREEGGIEFGFHAAIAPLDLLIKMHKKLKLERSSELPVAYTLAIVEALEEVLNHLVKMIQFKVESFPNPTQERDLLIGTLRGFFKKNFDSVTPLIAYIESTDINKQEDFEKAKLKIIEEMESKSREIEEILKKSKDNSEALERITKEARPESAKTGIHKEAIHFQGEAKHYSNEAENWMIRSVGLAVITVLIGIELFVIPWHSLFMEGFSKERVIWMYVQIGLLKALLLGSGLTATIFCVRSYTSARHNEVINRHREKALRTFNSLVDGGQSQATRDKVLEQAAACIYAPQDTGFNRKGGAGDSTTLSVNLPGVTAQTN